MASITRRGKYWRVQIERKGYPYQHRTFDSKAEAEKWATSVESEMVRRVYRDNTGAYKLSFSDALDKYAKSVSARKKGARQEASRIKAWRAHTLATRPLGDLRPSDFAECRDAMRKAGKSENTIRLALALVSNLFTVARKEWGFEGLMNPLESVTKPKGSTARDRRISPEELQALIDATDSAALAAALRLAVETAMRRSEIVVTLRWEQIDLAARVATLGDTKTGEARHVPLSAVAVELLRNLPGEHKGRVFKVTPDALTRAFVKARKRARRRYELECAARGEKPDAGFLVNIRFHDARHEATSSLFERGLNVMEAAAVTGHKDLKMLKRYTHFNASQLAEKIDGHTVADDGEHAHPGVKLRQYLSSPVKIADAVKRTGATKRELQEIIAGRARIDADLALRLEALGPRAEMWAELQALHDVAQARKAREAKASEASNVIALPTRRRASTK